MKVHLLINPKSGSFKSLNVEKLVATLRDTYSNLITHRIDVFEVGYIMELIAGADIVAVVGGDGTISIVVDAIMRTGDNQQLMVIPTGTMNDFSYSIGMRKSHSAQFSWISNSGSKSVDVVKVNERYISYLIGLGSFMESFTMPSSIEKRKMGKLVYLLMGLKGVVKIPTFQVKMNGEEIFAKIIVLSNISSVGGFRTLFKDAKSDDGDMHMLAIRRLNPWIIVKLITLLFLGSLHKSKHVEFRKYQQLDIVSRDLKVMDVDGDSSPFQALNIKVIPKGLTVIVPKH